MPFQVTHPDGEPVIDRTQTGPPAPPQTGTVRAEDGAIVADSATIEIPRATPVFVNQPSPFEPVIDANGRITPRWWRFFDQLYRRTGGVVDNINRVPTTLLGSDSSSTAVLAFTGIVPTSEIAHIRQVSLGSITATGGSIVANPIPSLAILAMTGNVPTVVNA